MVTIKRPRRIAALAERGFEPDEGTAVSPGEADDGDPGARCARGRWCGERSHQHRHDCLGPSLALRDNRARSRGDRWNSSRARGIPAARPAGISSRCSPRRTEGQCFDTGDLRHWTCTRTSLGGASRAQLHATALGCCVAHPEVRRCGEGHRRKDPRHTQDDSRLATLGEVRSASRRRHEPPQRSLVRSADQGQPSHGCRWRRRARGPSKPGARTGGNTCRSGM